MDAKEARRSAYEGTRSAVVRDIFLAAQLGLTRISRHIGDRHFRADIVRELTADGYRVTEGDYDGDITIDWSTP